MELLRRDYQPQLREGIVLSIELIHSAKEDEKDGDMDVRVRVRPNNAELITNIGFRESEIALSDKKEPIDYFEMIVDEESAKYWESEDFKNLQNNSNAKNFLALQDQALICLYEKIKASFNANKSLITGVNQIVACAEKNLAILYRFLAASA